jgi:uncharacterized RDD family membrane protein YckC
VTDQPDPYAPPPEGGTFAQPSGGAAPAPPPYGTPPQPYGAPAWGSPPSGVSDYGSWGRRVGGRLLDALCVVIPSAIIGAATSSRGVYDVVALVITLAIAWMNGAQGQSPGKRVVGLRLVRDGDGSLIGGGMGILRELAHLLDTFSLLLGWFWPLWDKKRQTFADKIVGTVVVQT